MEEIKTNKEKEINNIMLKVGGKDFYCECGCNVFHQNESEIDKYFCNSCDNAYKGQKIKD